MVAVAERTFSPGLTRQWRLHTHELHEPPTVDHLLNFIERQKRSATDDRLHTLKSDRAPKAKSSVPAKRSALKLQDSAKHHNTPVDNTPISTVAVVRPPVRPLECL